MLYDWRWWGLVNAFFSPIYPSVIAIISKLASVCSTRHGRRETKCAIVSGIVSYTHWPALSGPPRLCIFSSARFVRVLSEEADWAFPYQPLVIRTTQEALSARCDGFYFGNESPAYQVELTRHYPVNALLLIAEQNTECIIGSAFCLIINNDEVKFSVNWTPSRIAGWEWIQKY